MSHWTFEPGELALPIHKILWAPTNSAHHNHLHVEGYPPVSGTLDQCTSKWTEAITEIRGALDGFFGEGDHYQVWDDSLGWTHMGVYNCRPIAGTDTPSQHAFSNAIDIGPYYGVEEQQVFYDFLTRKEDDMTPEQVRQIIREELDEALGQKIAFTDLDDKQRITRRTMLDVMSAAHGGLTLKEGIAKAATKPVNIDVTVSD